MKAGTESATVAQHPDKIGSLGVATLYAAVQGKKVQKNVDTGTSLITPESANRALRGPRGALLAARPTPAPTVTIDAHHHFWNPARIPQPWMTAEHAAIDRAFEPARPRAAAARSRRHARPCSSRAPGRTTDTDYMFELASDVPWVGGSSPGAGSTTSAARAHGSTSCSRRPKLRGIRHLIHLEPDPHWILRTGRPARARAARGGGLVLELPAVFPDHLGDVPELARRHPGLTLVVDHLGKPPLGTAQMAAGRAARARRPSSRTSSRRSPG